MKTRSHSFTTPTLEGHGEDRLVKDLLRALPREVKAKSSRVFAGALEGDDCAVIVESKSSWRLLKTDCLIEGIHFLADADPVQVGWKALARVLSDFAAMGASQPKFVLVTVAFPTHTRLEWATGFYKGLGKLAKQFDLKVVGGETARSPGPIFISVALEGSIAPKHCVLRSGAKACDVLFVTGKLGGSLKSGRHLQFTPRLKEAHWLATQFPVSAMMDLSDGLGQDLPRFCAASKKGYELERAALPLHKEVKTEGAMSDGEDYELLFSIAEKSAKTLQKKWKAKFPKLELTAIGRVTARPSKKHLTKGFDHFSKC